MSMAQELVPPTAQTEAVQTTDYYIPSAELDQADLGQLH